METENNNSANLKLHPIPSPITHLSFMASQIWLRIMAAATSIAAVILLLNSRQSKVLFGTDMDARYTYSPAFKFFMFMNVVACALSVLSLLPVVTLGRKFSNSINYFYLFLHDLVMFIHFMHSLICFNYLFIFLCAVQLFARLPLPATCL
ncbi:putative casparian strip membrane protein [Helianthus annuus]|nr:putative casparian strip membrane protein [Helianthus annuus]